MTSAVLELRGVHKRFATADGEHMYAVNGVDLTVDEGETLGLVGESGSGKSTLARCAVRLLRPDSGTVSFAGRDITRLGMRALRPLRRELQVVFQDPLASLNPRRRVARIIADSLDIHRAPGDRRQQVREALASVGLGAEHAERYPHELSGGQQQRVGIARALIHHPRLVVCDEPVSSLDVSIQGQIINLLRDLQADRGLAYLFIAHDLAVVRHISHRVAVMYLGQIVELASVAALYARPIHPYTEALLAAAPRPDPGHRRRRAPVQGEAPNPSRPPSGCPFHPRCAYATDICHEQQPRLVAYGNGHLAACHHPRNSAVRA
jgi:oligopeptide/dipeptide ABC transporter ATP-binding protein